MYIYKTKKVCEKKEKKETTRDDFITGAVRSWMETEGRNYSLPRLPVLMMLTLLK